MQYEKEGQAAGAVNSIIVLIVGVGVSVLVLIFVGALGGQTYDLVQDDINEIGNNTINNETLYFAGNATAVQLSHTNLHSGVISIYNENVTLTSANYSVNTLLGQVTFIDNNFNETYYLTNYVWGNYEIGTTVKAGIISGFEALEQTGNYLPIIVLAVVISLVLMLILGFTALGGGMRGGSVL